MKNKLLFFLFWFLLAIDILSKMYAVKLLNQIIQTPLFFLKFEYTINTGVGFSLLNQIGQLHQTKLSILVGLIILFFAFFSFKKYQNGAFILPEILVLAGGIGNLICRIQYGGVIDFISFSIPNITSCVFNLADCYIFIGLFFLFYRLIDES